MSENHNQEYVACVKLFVGQIPRFWDDERLIQLFQEFGEVVEASVIYDKYTKLPKGCGFVTFKNPISAYIAQEKLHGKLVLDGMLYPMYVRPADIGGINGKKIFVGMIGKNTDSNTLSRIFSRFGPIEDVTVLKTPDGNPKGCAFIKFFNRDDAKNAVDLVHNKLILKGCHSPIVVKIAATENDKILKRFQSMMVAITKLIENATLTSLGTPDTKTINKNLRNIQNCRSLTSSNFIISSFNDENKVSNEKIISKSNISGNLTDELLKSLKISSPLELSYKIQTQNEDVDLSKENMPE